jgi:aminobenzoyl-glutamate utilization protein B
MRASTRPALGLADSIGELVDRHEAEFTSLADRVWETPEIGCAEHVSSAAQRALLEQHGFSIETGTAGFETAFVARRRVGVGGPTIGLLGEFDALPGLSQDRVPYRQPLVENGLGHGCGHNLLGTGALGAAIVAADVAELHGLALEVVYFGCPDEEGIVGKVVMAREHAFDGLDAALSWHPAQFNTLWDGSALALETMSFRFTGRSSHASTDPYNGRSALDAVELMNVGVNYLREHMPATARVHYVIRHGGDAPNIVPDYALSDYRVRERTSEDVHGLRERVFDCARGAALMTGTTVSWKLTSACSSLVPNDVLGGVLLDSLRAVGPPRFDDEDRAFARAIRDGLPAAQIRAGLRAGQVPDELHDAVLHERVDAPFRPGLTSFGSTDVGDVSWCVPTSQLYVATMPIGTPGHSWQVTASSGCGVGRKGMLTVAAALGLAAVELAAQPGHLEAARQEFRSRTGGRPYEAPIPPGFRPRGDLVPVEDDGQGWQPLA